MANLTPTPVTPPDTHDDDPRLGHLLTEAEPTVLDASVVLLGFPVDDGVTRNDGRPGAAEAPNRLRQWLYRMTPDARRHEAFIDLLRHSVDLGDLSTDAPLGDLQSSLGTVLAEHLREGRIPITLGGGHETAYGHFLGYVEAERDVTILNWDAHVDVRPLHDGQPHSGSSFRQALQHPSGHCRHYVVAGLLPHSTAPAHLQFIKEHDGRYVWSDDLSREAIENLYARASAPLMVTFDLDAVDQVHAPGVSAPAVGGLSRRLWLHAAYHAGRSPKVRSVDLVELNPNVDVDDRTARLAALTVLEILRGLADRMYRG